MMSVSTDKLHSRSFKLKYINKTKKVAIPPVVWTTIKNVQDQCYRERKQTMSPNNNDFNDIESVNENESSKDGVYDTVRSSPIFTSYPL